MSSDEIRANLLQALNDARSDTAAEIEALQALLEDIDAAIVALTPSSAATAASAA